MDAMNALMLQFGNEGFIRYPEWMKTVERTRSLFAQLIKADPSEICFTSNTSEGLSTVAGGISWKAGRQDHRARPGLSFQCVSMGESGALRGGDMFSSQENEGRFGVSDVEAVLAAWNRLVAVSSTDFTTGFRCDLEELGDFCRRKGILLCVDAIQSLGAVPLDVKSCGVHFLACGGHKWLLEHDGNRGAFYLEGGERSSSSHQGRVAQCRKRRRFLQPGT